MAGPVRWNLASYDNVRASLLALAASGEGIDFDGYYGYQCWDVGANMYWNAGLGTFRTKNSFTGAGGEDSYVYTTWTYQPAFQANTEDPFEAVTNPANIKRGDMIIWGAGGPIAATGHNAFADEDWNVNKTTISSLGQNQPAATGGRPPSILEISKTGILGAFRYKPWNGGGPGPEPPTPEPPLSIAKSDFPWFLYARRLREQH